MRRPRSGHPCAGRSSPRRWPASDGPSPGHALVCAGRDELPDRGDGDAPDAADLVGLDATCPDQIKDPVAADTEDTCRLLDGQEHRLHKVLLLDQVSPAASRVAEMPAAAPRTTPARMGGQMTRAR